MAAGTRDSTGRPGRNYWQLWTEYTIQARLEPSTSRLTGRESIVLHNNSDSAMRTIVMRLDQNIYAPNVPRDQQMPDITDGMKITRLSVNGQNAELKGEPGSCLPSDRHGAAPEPPLTAPRATGLGITSACIGLPSPIASKAVARIEVEWSFKVPHVEGEHGMRMGTWGDTLYEIAQWYPRVAVFDDLREGGWDTEQYLGNAEFYNNYGHFDVSIDVPGGVDRRRDGGTAESRSRCSRPRSASGCRTCSNRIPRAPLSAPASVARASSRRPAIVSSGTSWPTPSRTSRGARRISTCGTRRARRFPGKVRFRSVCSISRVTRASTPTVGSTLRHALEFYSKLWMPYAWSTFSVIEGPDDGMEYPQLIMSS